VRSEYPSRLYVLLGRRPASELADEPACRLNERSGSSCRIRGRRSIGTPHGAGGGLGRGFSLDDVDRLRPAFTLAKATQKFGKSPAEAVRPSIGSERPAISPLVAYLEPDGAKWLEQEGLDPAIPQIG
jgi:hypothetical protein